MNPSMRRFLPFGLLALAAVMLLAFFAIRLLSRQLDGMGQEQVYTPQGDEYVLASATTPDWGTVQLWTEGQQWEAQGLPGIPLTALVGRDTIFQQDNAQLRWSCSAGVFAIPDRQPASHTTLPPNETVYWQPADQGTITVEILDNQQTVLVCLQAVFETRNGTVHIVP